MVLFLRNHKADSLFDKRRQPLLIQFSDLLSVEVAYFSKSLFRLCLYSLQVVRFGPEIEYDLLRLS